MIVVEPILQKTDISNPIHSQNQQAAMIQEDLLARVEAALDQVRPYMQADGGNVKVLEITDDYVLRLQMLGACGTCPMSEMTLKAGVEQSVMRAVPEIKAVIAVGDVLPQFNELEKIG
jgi:Fe-S cluster biogenesis protein NfuA